LGKLASGLSNGVSAPGNSGLSGSFLRRSKWFPVVANFLESFLLGKEITTKGKEVASQGKVVDALLKF
jgi:hypothetical protein